MPSPRSSIRFLTRYNVTGQRQLDIWQGEFGQAYTDRNVIDWQTRRPAFQQILEGIEISQALEVGCNRGHNLIALADLFGDGCDVVGIEPNRHALELVRASSVKVGALPGNVFDLPFKDQSFDLVFTAGVLIHIALDDLAAALSEIHRVSRRYILAIEYFAEEETVINYRGYDDALWKRDFLKHYQSHFPGLSLLRHGYWESEHGFDRTHWWLLEK